MQSEGKTSAVRNPPLESPCALPFEPQRSGKILAQSVLVSLSSDIKRHS